MKSAKKLAILVLALGLMLWPVEVSEAAEMGTAFTYQGRLIDANSAAEGLYDFQFKLFDDANTITGTQLGSPIDINELDVIDGYFTVELDFGSDVFDGDARWLEIGVRSYDPCDVNAFTTLSPRQEVTPVPYAIYAQTSGYAETAGGGISGSGTANYIAKFTGPNTLGDSAIYEEAGNVGIGTTGPEEKLDVDGKVIVRGKALKVIGGPGSYLQVGMQPLGYYTTFSYESDGSMYDTYIRNTCGKGVGCDLILDFPYGNVGIGTTSPDEKVHVTGNTKVEGDLVVTGAYRGSIGPNGGAPFPRPAYDSGWVTATDSITLFHNIGGNVDNYVVDGQMKAAEMGLCHYNYRNLTTNSIILHVYETGTVRVRIWVYN